ncbi:MAG: SDR family oxidoreductase [Novosphingobium sp.]|nr:SDR family oxidoreductase [Novosphingobium sp.]
MSIAIDMKGKTAIVTGAASGLGKVTAMKLARTGADLCLVDFNEAGLNETGALAQSEGVQVLCHRADLSDPDQCRPVVDAALAHFGRLDALCNVAGIIRMAHAHDMARQDWDRIIAVNLTAPFLLSQAAIPHLIETEGAIVNVASSASYIGEAYAVAYCSSKFGLLGMTKALAMEYTRQPIRINAVGPGGMATNIGSDMSFPENPDLELMSRYMGLRGMVEVEDVADMIALLASPAGRSFHGACINIDAGITAG